MMSDSLPIEACGPANPRRPVLIGVADADLEQTLSVLLRGPSFGAPSIRVLHDVEAAAPAEGTVMLADMAFLRGALAKRKAWDALRPAVLLVLLLPEAELLRAIPVLPHVDGLSFSHPEEGWHAGRIKADIALAGLGYLALSPALLRRLSDGGLRLHALQHLSKTERSCLSCLGLGLSNEQIARHLRRPSATVKAAVRSILAKLGLPNRTAAAVFARSLAGMEKSGPDRGGGRQGASGGGAIWFSRPTHASME